MPLVERGRAGLPRKSSCSNQPPGAAAERLQTVIDGLERSTDRYWVRTAADKDVTVRRWVTLTASR